MRAALELARAGDDRNRQIVAEFDRSRRSTTGAAEVLALKAFPFPARPCRAECAGSTRFGMSRISGLRHRRHPAARRCCHYVRRAAMSSSSSADVTFALSPAMKTYRSKTRPARQLWRLGSEHTPCRPIGFMISMSPCSVVHGNPAGARFDLADAGKRPRESGDGRSGFSATMTTPAIPAFAPLAWTWNAGFQKFSGKCCWQVK